MISHWSAGGSRPTSSRASRAIRATSRWPVGSAGPVSASEASRWTSAGSWTSSRTAIRSSWWIGSSRWKGPRIVGIKNVTINEPFFQGHFPGQPIMPGVLIIEAMAQAGGMLLLGTIERSRPEGRVLHVARQREVPPAGAPGDQLRCRGGDAPVPGRTCRLKGVAYVDGQVVAEAEMLARVVDR